MERAGEKLKRARERLKLTFRDVEQASQKVAAERGSEEFAVALSRLADIENKGTIPSIYRLYTLCVIYRLDMDEVLRWYGVPREQMTADALRIRHEETHPIHVGVAGPVPLPQPMDAEIDLKRTTFLSHMIHRWGKCSLALLGGMDLKQHRYALVGMEDWSMYPILQPGSLLAVDEGRRKIASGGWSNEYDRPIYFLEHRDGYLCGWCSTDNGRLVIQFHPASHHPPRTFEYPNEIEVVGQVVGAAMPLDARRRRHRH